MSNTNDKLDTLLSLTAAIKGDTEVNAENITILSQHVADFKVRIEELEANKPSKVDIATITDVVKQVVTTKQAQAIGGNKPSKRASQQFRTANGSYDVSAHAADINNNKDLYPAVDTADGVLDTFNKAVKPSAIVLLRDLPTVSAAAAKASLGLVMRTVSNAHDIYDYVEDRAVHIADGLDTLGRVAGSSLSALEASAKKMEVKSHIKARKANRECLDILTKEAKANPEDLESIQALATKLGLGTINVSKEEQGDHQVDLDSEFTNIVSSGLK